LSFSWLHSKLLTDLEIGDASTFKLVNVGEENNMQENKIE
jgi:hypothetical protein